MAKRTTQVIEPHYTPSYIVIEEWNGISKGDPVKVNGERGEFTFQSIHEKDGQVISVIVHGGTLGNKTIRAFYPHRVTKAPKRRKRNIEE